MRWALEIVVFLVFAGMAAPVVWRLRGLSVLRAALSREPPYMRVAVCAFFVAAVIYGGGKGDGNPPRSGESPNEKCKIENEEMGTGNGERGTGDATQPPILHSTFSILHSPVFSNLCFTSIAATPTNVALGIGWDALTNTTAAIDIYSKTNLPERLWRHLAEMEVDVSDEAAVAEIPLNWIDWPSRVFFSLGDRLDSDGDGLPDAFEALAFESDPAIADSDGDGVPDGQEYALGTNPGAADTDGDLLPDGEEVSLGTDPVAADTDGDELEDYEEVGLVELLEGADFLWFDLTNAVDMVNGQTFADGRSWTVPLDYELELHRTFYTNAVVGLNGIVHLLNPLGDASSAKVDCNHSGGLLYRAWSDRHATVALCNAQLRADAAWGSQILCGSVAMPGSEKFDVIEFRNVGLAGEGHTNQLVTCQFIMSNLDDAVIYASYLSASNAFRSADILCGVQMGEYKPQGRDRSRYCLECPGGIPGDRTTVKYTIGTGTDPLDPDTDCDGLGDSEEAYGYETSPFQPDTDGDGMADGWEHSYGLNPLNPNDGPVDSDADGLSNVDEYFNATNPGNPDTDGEGVNDGVEVNNGTDPNNPSDGANPPAAEEFLTLPFHIYGDYAAWEMTVVAKTNDTRTFRLVTNVPAQSNTRSLKLLRGASYEISLRWRGDGNHYDHEWYCWEAQIGNPLSPSSRCFYDYSPTRLEGNEILVGDGWICENADGLLTSHVHTHDEDGGNIAVGKTATLHVLGGALRADLDRDGAIGATENATPSSPLRMWLNNDDDSGAVQEDSVKDAPGEGSSDSGDNVVDGLSDLVDFFPVKIDFREALATINGISGINASDVEVRLSCNGAALGCVETGFLASEAGKHLSNPNVGLGSAVVSTVDTNITMLSQSFSSAMRQNPAKGVVLLEGKTRSSEGTAAMLTAELRYDGTNVLAATLPVLVAPVEEFYRWYNFRAVAGGAVSNASDTEAPDAFPDSASDQKNIVFIHGFSVNEQGARAWSAEMFKRLWQSGSNSKFHAVTWRGNEGLPDGFHYHDNVENAFATASTFASQFSSLSGETTVIAHSLGNMVVSSAIQDHGLRPDRFFMLNAAVPAEAFDESEWDDTALFNPMVHQEWVNYPSRTWASHWHDLFQTDDIRHGLTWTNRFADVPDLTDLYNYYSTGDEILAVYDTLNADGSGKITIDSVTGGALRNYSWQKQERFKGRAGIDPLAGFGGTSDMGWGFSTLGYWEQGSPPMYDDYYVAGEFVMNHVRTAKYTFAQATAAVNAQLVSDPVFRHGIALGIPSGSMASSEKDVHLARGVPALSGPAGSRAIGVLPQARNENLNGRTGGSSWPRNSASDWPGWRHGDIKDIAMPFVFDVFLDICGAMEDSQ